MSKSILVIDTPDCCYECFAFDDNGDYPMCLVTGECRGYTFMARENKMDKCPLKPLPKKIDFNGAFEAGYNWCINDILGENK